MAKLRVLICNFEDKIMQNCASRSFNMYFLVNRSDLENDAGKDENMDEYETINFSQCIYDNGKVKGSLHSQLLKTNDYSSLEFPILLKSFMKYFF